MNVKKSISLLVTLITLLATGCSETLSNSSQEVSQVVSPEEAAVAVISEFYGDEGLGIREQTLFDETGVEPPLATFTTQPPGTSQRLARAYSLAPPQIPHSTVGLLPITKNGNACVGCHMPAVATAIGATPIPESHMASPELSNRRYNCSQCHVPQASVASVVENDF